MNAAAPTPNPRPTWPVAGGSLALGFAVASLTGVRPLGGAVLIAALAWCWLRWRRARGTLIAGVLVAIYAVLFAVSHVIGDVVTTWGAVALVSATMAVLAWALADRTA